MARILVALLVAAVMQALVASAHGSRVSEAKQGQFPYQALLQVGSTAADAVDKGVFHLCNGALVNLEWILTTNSCVNGTSRVKYYDVAVLLGSSNLNTDDQHLSILYTVIDKIIASDAADLALVRLPAEVYTQTETSAISPVRLPPKKYQNKSYLLWKATVSHYSPSTSKDDPAVLKKWLLQYSSARVQSDLLCRFELGQEAFKDGSLCLFGSLKTLGTTCTRIAGSPLVVAESDGKLTLLGIGAGGDAAACNDAKAARFIEVAPHLDWISQTAGIPLRE